MALSRHSINKLFEAHGWHYFASKPDLFIPVARAIEAEVRKQDTELIRQMVLALLACLRTSKEYENSDDLLWMQYALPAIIKNAKIRLGE